MLRANRELELNIPIVSDSLNDYEDNDVEEGEINWVEWRERVKETLNMARQANTRFANDRQIDGNGTVKTTYDLIAKAQEFEQKHRHWYVELDKAISANANDYEENDLNNSAKTRIKQTKCAEKKRLHPLEAKITPKVTKIFLPSLQTINELDVVREAQPIETAKPSNKKHERKNPTSKNINCPLKSVRFEFEELNNVDKEINKTDKSIKRLRSELDARLGSSQTKLSAKNSKESLLQAIQVNQVKSDIGVVLQRPKTLPSIPTKKLESIRHVIVNAKRLCDEYTDDVEQTRLY